MTEYRTFPQIDLDTYPLPIAYELQQLDRIPRAESRYRLRQLANVFEFALRYCAVIALSEYRREILETAFRSADVDALIADTIDNPTVDVCAKLLQEIMYKHRGRRDRLIVPDLYEFCYRADGRPSDAWDAVEGLKRLSHLDESLIEQGVQWNNLYDRWFEEHRPLMEEFLEALDFLREYDLVRLIDCREVGGKYIWIVKLLRGPALDPPLREMADQDESFEEGHTLAVWNHDQQCPLYLLPFAIFEHCGTPPNDDEQLTEDFFFYEKYELDEMTFVGLRDWRIARSLPHRPHRITLGEYIDIIESFRRETGYRSALIQNWPEFVKRCTALSWDQLLVFQRDKYDPGVYIERSEVEGHFQAFLGSEETGLLVVGDSGTGKTNLLCSLAERLLDTGGAVFLYNCADIRDESPDISHVLGQSLRLNTSILDFLLRTERSHTSREPWKLFCLLDAVNEAGDPLKLLLSIVEFVRDVALLGLTAVEVKVIVSCRSESWGRLRPSFVGDRYFYHAGEEVAVPLKRFTDGEVAQAYRKYKSAYRLQTTFEELTDSVKSFIRDPLMMRLLAESYEGKRLPDVPKTRRVFENYIQRKIGYEEQGRRPETIEETRFVERLVDKMLALGREELDIKADLRDDPDPELRQQVLDPKLTSPYWQLRDKGVLTAFGREDLADRSPRKVKFTYDRVFEYLLQRRLFPRELTLDNVDAIIEQIHRSRSFVSLWGAVRVALQMYFDERAPGNAPVLTELSTMADTQVRAIMVDMLTEYGLDRPNKVEIYLSETLLPLESEEAGQIAVQVAYELALKDALEKCLVHPSDLVQQLATQNVFYLWQQQPAEGAIIMERLYKRIEAQWERILTSVARKVWRGYRGIDLVTGLEPFLNLFALFIGYAYMAGPEIQPVGRQFSRFVSLISTGALGWVVNRLLWRWGDATTQGASDSAATYGTKLLRVVFEYPPDHPLRKSIADFADYVDPSVPIPDQILDQMFEVAQVDEVATPMFVVAGIFYARGKDLDTVYSFCRRLFFEGNIYSKNLALRILSLIVYMEELGGEYAEFVEEMLLELWTGEEATYRYPIMEDTDLPPVEVEHTVGYLNMPVLYECRTKTGGSSEFVEKILALPWHGDPTHRIIRICECLEDAFMLAGATKRTNITPILETLRQWVRHDDPDVRRALVDLLSYARSFYPTEVDQFLDSLQDEPRKDGEDSDGRSAQLVREVHERFKLRPLTELFVGSFIVGAPWLQQKSKLFQNLLIQVLKDATDPNTDWNAMMNMLARGIGSLEMVKEIAHLISTNT